MELPRSSGTARAGIAISDARDELLDAVVRLLRLLDRPPDARIYYERAHADYWTKPPQPSTAPTALAVFPRDNSIPLRHIAEPTNHIVQWTEFDRGGHFAAMEQPALLVNDVTTFFRRLREAAPTS